MTKVPTEMTALEFDQWVINEMLQGWIPLKMYQKLFPHETRVAIDTRVSRGHWKRGVHYNTPDGGGPWVNLKAIRAWASGEEAVG